MGSGWWVGGGLVVGWWWFWWVVDGCRVGGDAVLVFGG